MGSGSGETLALKAAETMFAIEADETSASISAAKFEVDIDDGTLSIFASSPNVDQLDCPDSLSPTILARGEEQLGCNIVMGEGTSAEVWQKSTGDGSAIVSAWEPGPLADRASISALAFFNITRSWRRRALKNQFEIWPVSC